MVMPVLIGQLPGLVAQLADGMNAARGSQSEMISGASMTLWHAIVIGIVQGLTEFLPISSTAHVKIVPVLLGWGDPGVAFTAVIQLGSEAAVLWYFWEDISTVTRKFIGSAVSRDFHTPAFRLGLGIVLGTLPIVAVGLFLKVFVPAYETSVVRSTGAIAITSIVMAILLGAAEYLGSRKRDFSQLDTNDGIGIGLAQAMALVPGVSRSGSTLTAGLFFGLKRETAARFSFLLGIPAIFLAGLVSIADVIGGNDAIGILPLVGGLLSTVVSSYLAIAWLIEFLKKHSTWVFVWYRLAFGAVLLIAIALGQIQNV